MLIVKSRKRKLMKCEYNGKRTKEDGWPPLLPTPRSLFRILTEGLGFNRWKELCARPKTSHKVSSYPPPLSQDNAKFSQGMLSLRQVPLLAYNGSQLFFFLQHEMLREFPIWGSIISKWESQDSLSFLTGYLYGRTKLIIDHLLLRLTSCMKVNKKLEWPN